MESPRCAASKTPAFVHIVEMAAVHLSAGARDDGSPALNHAPHCCPSWCFVTPTTSTRTPATPQRQTRQLSCAGRGRSVGNRAVFPRGDHERDNGRHSPRRVFVIRPRTSPPDLFWFFRGVPRRRRRRGRARSSGGACVYVVSRASCQLFEGRTRRS